MSDENLQAGPPESRERQRQSRFLAFWRATFSISSTAQPGSPLLRLLGPIFNTTEVTKALYFK